ncbi:Hypothetical protein PHPALM_19124, partial [Phytophthora palmivora]
KYTRAQVTGSDTLRAIELAQMRNVAEDDVRLFLQFSVVHTMGCAQHKCLGFGHPDLIRLLRYSGTALFIDCTFKMVPKPFSQCLIVMVREPKRIPLDQISAALAPDVLDVPTLIPVDEIPDKGIRYVRSRMDETGAKTKWDAFWRYFKSTWIRSYGADLWNVNNMAAAGIDLTNRTNNPLERYNQAFGERFSVAHPSLLSFIEKAKSDSRRYVQMIEDIKHHRRDPPKHAPYVEPRIPDEYATIISR